MARQGEGQQACAAQWSSVRRWRGLGRRHRGQVVGIGRATLLALIVRRLIRGQSAWSELVISPRGASHKVRGRRETIISTEAVVAVHAGNEREIPRLFPSSTTSHR